MRALALLAMLASCSAVARPYDEDAGAADALGRDGDPAGDGAGEEPEPGCAPRDEICCDGVDDDCDGQTDEGCGCGSECLCYPGTTRFCDVQVYCLIGEQVCSPDGQSFGECVEVRRPSECGLLNTRYSPNFVLCLIENGMCGQDRWDHDGDGDLEESVGDCSGVICGWDD